MEESKVVNDYPSNRNDFWKPTRAITVPKAISARGFDCYTIHSIAKRTIIGYIPKELTRELSKVIDMRIPVKTSLMQIIGGYSYKETLGALINMTEKVCLGIVGVYSGVGKEIALTSGNLIGQMSKFLLLSFWK